MTSPQTEPFAQALGERMAALAVQVAALRGQIALVNVRLDRAGLRGDMDVAARFEDLAQTVADALDAAAPRGSAAPCWIGFQRCVAIPGRQLLRNARYKYLAVNRRSPSVLSNTSASQRYWLSARSRIDCPVLRMRCEARA